jgi:hypothetical protein
MITCRALASVLTSISFIVLELVDDPVTPSPVQKLAASRVIIEEVIISALSNIVAGEPQALGHADGGLDHGVRDALPFKVSMERFDGSITAGLS